MLQYFTLDVLYNQSTYVRQTSLWELLLESSNVV